MWQPYVIGVNGVKVLLHVQDAEIDNPTLLHFDTRMSRSQWTSHFTTRDDIKRLYATHHDTQDPRPLFVLSGQPVLQLTLSDPENVIYNMGATMVQPVWAENEWVILINTDQAAPVSFRLWARALETRGQYAIWRIHCTLHTSRLVHGSRKAIAATTLRIRHLLFGIVSSIYISSLCF